MTIFEVLDRKMDGGGVERKGRRASGGYGTSPVVAPVGYLKGAVSGGIFGDDGVFGVTGLGSGGGEERKSRNGFESRFGRGSMALPLVETTEATENRSKEIIEGFGRRSSASLDEKFGRGSIELLNDKSKKQDIKAKNGGKSSENLNSKVLRKDTESLSSIASLSDTDEESAAPADKNILNGSCLPNLKGAGIPQTVSLPSDLETIKLLRLEILEGKTREETLIEEAKLSQSKIVTFEESILKLTESNKQSILTVEAKNVLNISQIQETHKAAVLQTKAEHDHILAEAKVNNEQTVNQIQSKHKQLTFLNQEKHDLMVIKLSEAHDASLIESLKQQTEDRNIFLEERIIFSEQMESTKEIFNVSGTCSMMPTFNIFR